MHETIIKTVLDNGGTIVGGYVREWVRFGEPQLNGWSDIDVLCEKNENKTIIAKKLFEVGIDADFRATPPFNDFFCNCWMFDGKIKPVEAKDKRFSPEEIMEQTQKNEARMMNSFSVRSDKIIFFLENKWSVFTADGNCPSLKFWNNFLSAPSVAVCSFRKNPFNKFNKFSA